MVDMQLPEEEITSLPQLQIMLPKVDDFNRGGSPNTHVFSQVSSKDENDSVF